MQELYSNWHACTLALVVLLIAIGSYFLRRKDGKKTLLSALLKERKRDVHSVTPDVSISECVHLMNQHDIGAILVMEDNRLLGIFTERDAITKVLEAGLEPSYTKVSAVMSHDPFCAAPNTTLGEAMTTVLNQNIRHLPVVEDDKVLGMLSSHDLTRWLLRAPR